MQRRFRLTRSEDFQRVRRSGKSYAHPLVVLVALKRETAHTRVGVTAGKTTGTAVRRNRAKRLLREAVRPMLGALPAHWEMILIARPAMAAATIEQVRAAVADVLRRAALLPVNEH